MESKNLIHLALAFDQNFITPFYVLLTSIFSNNKKSNFCFHVIATGVDRKELNDISSFVGKNNSSINFYDISSTDATSFIIPEKTHFTISTYYRLFFPSLIDNKIKKLLYIDTDIVVIGELSELYDTSVSLPVAAVPDPKIEARPELGIFEAGNYFNAGVLLINIDEWNKQKISEKASQFLGDFPEKIKLVDQDALNAVLNNNWQRLPSKYNVTFYHLPEYFPKKEFENFLKDKVIIHYSTQTKPWQISCTNRLRYLYHYYLIKSPKTGSVNQKEGMKIKYWYPQLKRKIKEILVDHTRIFSLRNR